MTFFKLFESFCIDEGAVFFNSAFNIVHLLLKPMDKDFPLKSSCGLLLIRNIDSKIYVTTINVSTKSSVTQYFYLVDGKYHCLMLGLIYSSMQEILLWDFLVHSPFVCCLLWLPCCAWHWVIIHFIISAII